MLPAHLLPFTDAKLIGGVEVPVRFDTPHCLAVGNSSMLVNSFEHRTLNAWILVVAVDEKGVSFNEPCGIIHFVETAFGQHLPFGPVRWRGGPGHDYAPSICTKAIEPHFVLREVIVVAIPALYGKRVPAKVGRVVALLDDRECLADANFHFPRRPMRRCRWTMVRGKIGAPMLRSVPKVSRNPNLEDDSTM